MFGLNAIVNITLDNKEIVSLICKVTKRMKSNDELPFSRPIQIQDLEAF